MLEAGKVGLLVVNIQEETELTGKIVTAAKSSNIPIVELTEQMPEQYDSPDGLDGRARRRVLPSHLMRTDKKDAKVDKKRAIPLKEPPISV